MARRRWNQLSPRTRRLIVLAALAESAVKTVALVDLARRPAVQIRGPKWAWITGVALANSAGLVPVIYLRIGRRARPELH